MNEYDSFKSKPIIELSENVFKIILPNRNYIESEKNENISINNMSQEEIIINYLKHNTRITRLEVEKILNIGTTRSKQIIKTLVKDSILIKEGVGKNTYYVLK